MNDMKPLEINDVTFDEYKAWFEKYKNNKDVREIKIQNEVVKRFISETCPNLDVEACDNKGPESPNHNYLQYCGTYIDKGKKKPSTPDLVIAKNWNWLNEENNVDYRAVVEVKSPYLDQPIYNKEYQKYREKLKIKLRLHFSARDNDKVILTDALKWEFYKKNEKENELVPIRTFRLYDLCGGRGKWEWKKGELEIVEDDVIKEIFNSPLERTKPVKEFEELKAFLIEFLYKED
ncbi:MULTISPECIES: hypothetical protein [Bacillati]|uniref:hypothetical protein n=1 Tax=Bacillati TaxID=1783272 RepID=UPI0034454A9C